MKTFLNVLEEKMKPPFKYFLLPQGCFSRGSYTSAMTLKEAKKKAEEFVLEFKSPIQIMKVFYNDNEERLGYMGKRILILDRDFNWEKDITDDLCLHVAFFYKDCLVQQWNPELYDKLRKDWDNKLLESIFVITNKGIGYYVDCQNKWFVYWNVTGSYECSTEVVAWCELPKFEVEKL